MITKKYFLQTGKGDYNKITSISLMKKCNKGACIAESIWVLNFRNYKINKLLFSLLKSDDIR